MLQATAPTLEQAVSEIFVALREPVYRYAFSILSRRGEAEEVTQDAFVRLYSELRKGRTVENVRAWVFRVAHNIAIDRFRGQEPFEMTEIGDEDAAATLEDPAPSAEAVVLAAERRRRVRSALCRLSPQERQCLQLRGSGLRYREIAEVLAIRIPTVQTLLARAIKKIEGATQ